MWLPASVPDDLLCVAAGLQPTAVRAAPPLQCGACPLRHPPGVCQGEGDADHPGGLQGRLELEEFFFQCSHMKEYSGANQPTVLLFEALVLMIALNYKGIETPFSMPSLISVSCCSALWG